MSSITGTVVKGQQKGAILGFPTANIQPTETISIEPGIYAGYIFLENERFQAALYIPTNHIIEAFLLDFDEDLYGKTVTVEIVKKIRGVMEFKTNAEASAQIAKDVQQVKIYLQ